MTEQLSHFLRANSSSLQHLTLNRADRDGRATWQANCLHNGNGGYVIAYHDDPNEALAQALIRSGALKRGNPTVEAPAAEPTDDDSLDFLG